MCVCVFLVFGGLFFLSAFFVRKERKGWSYMGKEVEWIWEKPREGNQEKNILYKNIFFQLKTTTKASLTILNSSCCQDIPLSQGEKSCGEQLSQPSNRYYAPHRWLYVHCPWGPCGAPHRWPCVHQGLESEWTDIHAEHASTEGENTIAIVLVQIFSPQNLFLILW